MIKVILTDMDGTLLNSAHQMPDQTEETIRLLLQKGVRFGVASGREYANIRAYFPSLADEMIFIADNGTLVYDRNEEIYVDSILEESVEALIHLIRRIPKTWIVLCGKDKTYVECTPERRKEIEAIASNFYYEIEMVEDAIVIAEQKEILEISIYCQEGSHEIAPLLDEIQKDFRVVVSGPYWIDILNHSAGKGNALQKLQIKYGWKREECMAFGDYLNDLEMLENCGYSFAMKNAHPKILETALEIAPGNEEGGVIQVIRQWLKEGKI